MEGGTFGVEVASLLMEIGTTIGGLVQALVAPLLALVLVQALVLMVVGLGLGGVALLQLELAGLGLVLTVVVLMVLLVSILTVDSDLDLDLVEVLGTQQTKSGLMGFVTLTFTTGTVMLPMAMELLGAVRY